MDDGRRFVSNHLNQPRDSNEADEKASEPTNIDASSSASLSLKTKTTKRAVSSLTESALLVDILKNEGYEVIEAAGAGYKILAVIQGNHC